MSKVACHVAVEEGIAHAKTLKKFGQDDTTNAIDAVDTNRKAGLANSIDIDQAQVDNRLDMTVVVTVVSNNVPYLSTSA